MVFLQKVPAQTVSWPNDPVQVRRPEGGIGPSYNKEKEKNGEKNKWDPLRKWAVLFDFIFDFQ